MLCTRRRLALLGLATLCSIARGEGVTLITHGFNPWFAAGATWPASMRGDIAQAYLANEQNFGTITVTGTAGNLTATCNPWNVGLASSTTGEVVIVLDWSAVADHTTTGISAQAVAAAILPDLIAAQGGQRPLAELPIHLVGHSRGGGMICEIARLLGEQGILVDQLSPLDPHPLSVVDPQPPFPFPAVIDTPARIYSNVLFADEYSQQIAYPMGIPLIGAFNRQWTNLPGGYHNNSAPYNLYADHRNLILLYNATLNLNSPLNNTEGALLATDRATWFNSYETNGGTPGQRSGFYYSRIAGHGERASTDQPNGADHIVDGLHNDPLIGGNGARTALTWGSAVWPNLATLEVRRGATTLGPSSVTITSGEQLTLRFVALDVDSPSTVTFHVDRDRNPYNANNVATIGSQILGATGTSFVQGTLAWNTAGLAPGTTLSVYGDISDGSRTRYLYATPSFQVQAGAFEGWLIR